MNIIERAKEYLGKAVEVLFVKGRSGSACLASGILKEVGDDYIALEDAHYNCTSRSDIEGSPIELLIDVRWIVSIALYQIDIPIIDIDLAIAVQSNGEEEADKTSNR